MTQENNILYNKNGTIITSDGMSYTMCHYLRDGGDYKLSTVRTEEEYGLLLAKIEEKGLSCGELFWNTRRCYDEINPVFNVRELCLNFDSTHKESVSVYYFKVNIDDFYIHEIVDVFLEKSNIDADVSVVVKTSTEEYRYEDY